MDIDRNGMTRSVREKRRKTRGKTGTRWVGVRKDRTATGSGWKEGELWTYVSTQQRIRQSSTREKETGIGQRRTVWERREERVKEDERIRE